MATKATKYKSLNKPSTAAIRAGLPSAVVPAKKNTSGGPGHGLTVVMPPETLLSIKRQALEEGSTVRAVILKALDKAGHHVPPHELTDRRRKA
jgi:hypothetical protein